MLHKLFFLAALIGLLNASIICDVNLGQTIRPGDCEWAFDILIAKLYLSDPLTSVFGGAQRTFTLDSGDPRYSMPQGSSFGTCGLGIDIAPTTSASTTWTEIALRIQSLTSRCPRQGLGGTAAFGQFTVMIVETGQGMRNLIGTCMSPSPARPLPLLWQMRERLCGFQYLAPFLIMPDRSYLPAPPAIFPTGLAIDSRAWPPYRVRGQWIWNANVWSPVLRNTLNQAGASAAWILMTGGGPQSSGSVHMAPFSRIIPQIMGATWIWQQTNHLPRQFYGAWGSHAFAWIPLIGDLTNVQHYINTYDWLLVVTGDHDPGVTMPAGQSQTRAAALGNTSSNQSFGQAQAPASGSGQEQALTPELLLLGPPGEQSRMRMNLTTMSRLARAQATDLAQSDEAAEAAAQVLREFLSLSGSQMPFPQSFGSSPPEPSATRDRESARLSKRPRPNYAGMER